MTQNHFDILILIGRPASGKSEIIDYLKHASPNERLNHFHIANLDMLDDFPMLWAWFEEDHILEHTLGLPRLHSDKEGYFLQPEYWHLLIERLALEYGKLTREPGYHDRTTTLVEFSRGSEYGGYTEAFSHLSDEILQRAVIVYVNVTFEESLRKNRRRFNPDKPDSILEHGLADDKLERLYRDDDWSSLATQDSGFIEVRGHQVPYAVFENMDDITTGQPERLAERLEEVLKTLWKLRQPA